MEIKTILRNFQIETVTKMIQFENQFDGGMLFNEPGTGKSLVILDLISKITLENKPTLILCPAGVVDNWYLEIKKHTNLEDKYILKYDRNRKKIKELNENSIKNIKIIISSYSIISRDFCDSFFIGLFKFLKVERIVLDEAHYIRNHKSTISKAVFFFSDQQNNLTKRWIVTATPFFNNQNDMYSYFKFLSLEAIDIRNDWTNRISKNINGMKILNNWIEKYSIKYCKNDVLKDLVPKIEKTIPLIFTEVEKEFYNCLWDYSIKRMSVLLLKIKQLNNDFNSKDIKKIMRGNVMTYILRLKQACNSPWLILQKMKRFNDITTLSSAITRFKYFQKSLENSDEECGICFDAKADTIAEPCGHKCCNDCWNKLFSIGIHQCPTCRNYIENILPVKSVQEVQEVDQNEVQEVDQNELKTSVKIKEVMNLTKEIIKKNEKIVIVSQWVSMLELVKETFSFDSELKDIKHISLQGNISIKNRTKYIKDFQEDPNIKICFISLTSSAEGINLIAANHLILLDRWWNSSKELQVCDRIHRILQTKTVYIYKFKIEDSIEEKINLFVNKKAKIAKLILSNWNIDNLETYDDSWISENIRLLPDYKKDEE